ncbi:DNA processing protein DprA [Bacteroidota bacterium]|nr:DNA processing protein DprA [Bacteroidota bacterium]
MLSNEKLKYAIALSRIAGVGDVIAKTLVSYCSGVENIFSKKKSQLLKVPGIGPILADAIVNYTDFSNEEKEIAFLRKHKIQTVFFTDANYPLGLKQVSDSPILLFQKGELNLNEGRFISLVGTRNATDYGKEWTSKFIEEIAAYHPTIVSGLAFGIDIAAHRAALKYGLKTIAVLGHPLNTIYPGQHRSTAEKIIEQGCLLTEFSTLDEFRKENFPERNRIVAGMCEATIVVESAAKGGALITAEIASSYNKDVFAVPGRIGDQYSAGCNYLIKQNKAALIENAEEFVQVMNWQSDEKKNAPIKQRQLFPELDANEQLAVDMIQQRETIHVDELMLQLKLSSSQFAAAVLGLELKGVIKVMPGKMYKLN